MLFTPSIVCILAAVLDYTEAASHPPRNVNLTVISLNEAPTTSKIHVSTGNQATKIEDGSIKVPEGPLKHKFESSSDEEAENNKEMKEDDVSDKIKEGILVKVLSESLPGGSPENHKEVNEDEKEESTNGNDTKELSKSDKVYPEKVPKDVSDLVEVAPARINTPARKVIQRLKNTKAYTVISNVIGAIASLVRMIFNLFVDPIAFIISLLKEVFGKGINLVDGAYGYGAILANGYFGSGAGFLNELCASGTEFTNKLRASGPIFEGIVVFSVLSLVLPPQLLKLFPTMWPQFLELISPMTPALSNLALLTKFLLPKLAFLLKSLLSELISMMRPLSPMLLLLTLGSLLAVWPFLGLFILMIPLLLQAEVLLGLYLLSVLGLA